MKPLTSREWYYLINMYRFTLVAVLLICGVSTTLAAPRAYEEIHELENVLQSEQGFDQIQVDDYLDRNQFAAKVVRLFPTIKAINSIQAEVLRLRLAEYLGDQKKLMWPDTDRLAVKLKAGVGELPSMTAKAFLIYDPVFDQVILQDNMNEVRSIASISKLFSAMVAADSFADDQSFIMSANAKTVGSSSDLPVGFTLSLSDALTYLLIRSSNDVANQVKLTHDQLYPSTPFVQKMNQKAREIGLVSTRFSGPSGLENDNVSTAYELAMTIDYMRTNYPELLSLGRQPILNRGSVKLESSSPIRLQSGWLGGKNGYISRSGRTTASLFSVDDKEVIIVHLGSVLNDDGRDNAALLSLVE